LVELLVCVLGARHGRHHFRLKHLSIMIPRLALRKGWTLWVLRPQDLVSAIFDVIQVRLSHFLSLLLPRLRRHRMRILSLQK